MKYHKFITSGNKWKQMEWENPPVNYQFTCKIQRIIYPISKKGDRSQFVGIFLLCSLFRDNSTTWCDFKFVDHVIDIKFDFDSIIRKEVA